MTKRSLLVILILMCFFGCGPSTGDHHEQSPSTPLSPVTVNGTEFDSTTVVAGKLTLFFPTGTTSPHKAFLIDAVNRQLDAFERDWGSPTTPTSIFLFNEDHIPCGNLVGTFGGCYFTANNDIHVTMGIFFAAWGVYHELVHLNIPGHNLNHEDPRWGSFWGPMQIQIWQEIVADHRIILGN